jgi:hypothetical protein
MASAQRHGRGSPPVAALLLPLLLAALLAPCQAKVTAAAAQPPRSDPWCRLTPRGVAARSSSRPLRRN